MKHLKGCLNELNGCKFHETEYYSNSINTVFL